MTTLSGVLSFRGPKLAARIGRTGSSRLGLLIVFGVLFLGLALSPLRVAVGWAVVEPETLWMFLRIVVLLASAWMCVSAGQRLFYTVVFHRQQQLLHGTLSEWARLCAVGDSLLARIRAEVFQKPGRLTSELLDSMSVAEHLMNCVHRRIDTVSGLAGNRRRRDIRGALKLLSEAFVLSNGTSVRPKGLRECFEDIFQEAELLLIEAKARAASSPELHP